jgi:hypothetical protein
MFCSDEATKSQFARTPTRDLPPACPAYPRGQCNGLTTRSLKPRPVTVSNRHTFKPCATLHQAQTDPSVLIRPLIATPAQGVSRSRAETDVLLLSAAAGPGICCRARMAPRPVQHGGGVESDISASRLESTDDRSKRCSGQKRDLGDPSPALSDGATVSGRDRLAAPRGRLQRPTFTPLSRARPCIRCKLDASVTIRPLITTLAQGVSRS